MALPRCCFPSLAFLARRYGVSGMVCLFTSAVALLSLLVTSAGLLLFQGYIDGLGIAISIFAPLLILPWPVGVFFSTFLRLQGAEEELRHRNHELEKALGEVKALSGLLPLCCSCKKVRDDQGYWQELEKYFTERLDLRMSHGFCPDCLTRLYPDVARKIQARAEADGRGPLSTPLRGLEEDKGV